MIHAHYFQTFCAHTHTCKYVCVYTYTVCIYAINWYMDVSIYSLFSLSEATYW